MNSLSSLALGLAGLTAAWLLTDDRLQAAPPQKGKAPAAVAAEIDRLVAKQCTEAKVPASPRADDAEFLRRATLDITGRIPTAQRTVAFLKDSDPGKRARLIDELLAERTYGEHFGMIWYHRIVKPDDDNRFLI